jgi:hypothetical protein
MLCEDMELSHTRLYVRGGWDDFNAGDEPSEGA